MTRIAVAGQALMKAPVPPDGADAEALQALLRDADLAVSNFEGTLDAGGGVPTKSGVVHAADPAVPAALGAMGIGAVTLANNHMYDFGPAGVIASRKAVAAADLMAAGAGADIGEAAAAALRTVGGLRVALIGADCGPQPDVVYATPSRAGINPLRMRRRLVVPVADVARLRAIVQASGYALWRDNRQAVGMPVPLADDAEDFFGLAVAPGGDIAYTATPDRGDLARLVATIRDARTRADLVVVVLHNHHWEPDWAAAPGWLRSLAGELAAAGAGLIACHGAPVLGGMALLAGTPVYFGLGNLVFHPGAARTERYRNHLPQVWSSVIATQNYDARGRLLAIEVAPINAGAPAAGAGPGPRWCAPTRLRGAAGQAVLAGFLARSDLGGWRADLDEGATVLRLAPA